MKDPVLDTYIKSFVEQFDLEELDPDKVFEHFVNYCIISKKYPRGFDFLGASTGGGDDIALDGIAIIANGVFIYSDDEVIELEKRNGYLDVSFHFIQSKSSQKFKGDQVGSFIFGVKSFFDSQPAIPENEDVAGFRAVKDAIYRKSMQFTQLPDLNMYFVTTGTWENPDQIQGRVTRELKDIHQKGLFRSFNFDFVDAEKLKGVYRELQRRIVKEIQFECQIPLPDIEGVKRSFIGAIPVKEFLKLITDSDGALQKSLFYDNIRDFQGHNRVNEEIFQTLKDVHRQSRLAILNNGITLIAKQIDPVGKKLKLSNFQIVNGCQTSNLLFDAAKYLQDGTHVSVKIIETVDQEIINEIIQATNNQTEVKREAFVSLLPFHKDLEEYYNARSRKMRYPIFYERRSKQYQDSTTVKPHQIITLAAQVKAFVAAFLNEPQSTHRYYGELLESYRDRLFVKEHSLSAYFASAVLQQRIWHLYEIQKIPTRYKFLRYQLMLAISAQYVDFQQLRGKEFEAQIEKLLVDLASLPKLLQLVAACCGLLNEALGESRIPMAAAARNRDFTRLIIQKVYAQRKGKSTSSPR